ncbi:MAG: HAD hydrolase-like protein [Coriobacteriia bacterium]|nr:HAD hydrolase-like protein [Coriobacteriia bacterium]
MALTRPDRYFSRISRINVRTDLLGCGLTHVLLDIDNTIRSRATGDIPLDVGLWLAQARDAGVQFCLLSNNWHANVHDFAHSLDLPLVAKACKPLPPAYFAARKKIGGVRGSTVVIGDQLSTDVVGAHVVGMKAYLVAPLVEQDLKHTLVVRRFERKLLGEMVPE